MSGSSSGSPSPAAPAEGGGALAPGFRFHPTDEELVGYYLKRKVLGRPFRVDAISEIDLYKTEPWDLPGKSRIQSRDTEWYFFSALDRKYANRSRTNRATGAGYWKTTGKDRAISRAGRTIGMKKTLVFHAGRAPKGARTNWVMHEYRLHDAHLPAAAVPQDGFVVCRIFQKRGPGPQNGAQYGAPLPVEDEWDECELPAIKEECGAEGSLSIGFSNPLPDGIADDDDDDPDADQGVEDRKPALALLVRTPGHGGDPNDCQEQELSNVVDGGTEGHELQEGDHNLAAPGASYADAADQWRSHAVLKDGYLELDDFADSAVANSRENAAAHPGEIIHNYEDSRQEDLNDVKEYFALNDENDDLSEHFSETGGGRRFLELGDLAGSEPHGSSSGEPADDGLVYFDATSHYPHGDHGFSSGMNCFLDAAMGGENGPDLMDEIMAYFDATENLQPSDLGIGSGASSSNQPCLAPAVNMDHTEAHGASPRSPAEAGCSSASPSSTPDVGKQSGSQGVDSHGEPDLQSGNSWEKALSKHLFNMLDAISPPPAFGEGHPMKGSQAIQHHSAARPSSSIHITAGMIQIHGVIMPGNGKNWSVQKNIDISFVFSYSEGSNVMDSGRMLKTPGGFLLRNSFHLLFLSVLFLTATFKIGLHVYTR